MSNNLKNATNELIRLYLLSYGVTPTELAYLDGVTGPIQMQINTNNPIGAHQAWIGAYAMWPRTTSGCSALTKREIGTSLVNIQSLNFDTTTQEFAQSFWSFPNTWDRGTVTATVYWTTTGGGVGQTVQWGISGGAYSNDDPLSTVLGSAQTVSDTWIADNDVHITSATSAITLAGTPADNDLIVLQISRNPASDDLAVDAELLGLMINYTTDASVTT